MEFTDLAQAALFKILQNKLPVPRSLEELYSVASRAGLSTEEFDALNTGMKEFVHPSDYFEGAESDFWANLYDQVNRQYGPKGNPNHVNEVPGPQMDGLDLYFPHPQFSRDDLGPNGESLGYDPKIGDPRPTEPDWYADEHPYLKKSWMARAGEGDYIGDYLDQRDQWEAVNSTPKASIQTSVGAAKGMGHYAIQKILEELLGNQPPLESPPGAPPQRVNENQPLYPPPVPRPNKIRGGRAAV